MYLIAPSVNVYIIKNDKVLLGRRQNTGYADGKLCPPGGHVEEGETPLQATVRELKEEVGIEIDAHDLEFVCVAARDDSPTAYVGYEFMLKDKDYTPANTEPEKCSELVWVDIADLPDDVISDFAEIIKRSILGNEKYLELGF